MSDESETKERVDELTNALASDPDEAELASLYIARAHCFDALGEDTRSVRDYLKALKFADDRTEIAHIKARISLVFLKKGNKEHSLWWALAGVDSDANSADAQYALGLSCKFSEFYALAVAALKRTVELDPENWPAHLPLARCLRDEFRLEEAIGILSKYIAANPDDPRGHYELGWVIQLSLGMPDRVKKAEMLYLDALKRDPCESLRRRIERKLSELA